MTNETKTKVLDCIELLLQCVELFPDARKHVEQYVTHGDIHDLQLQLKQTGEKNENKTSDI